MRDAASKYNVDHGGHHTTISTTFVDPVSACHALLAVCHGGFMILTPSPCPSTRHSARVVLQAPLSCGSRAQAEVQSVPTQPGIAQISNWPMQFFRWRSWPAGISTELPRTHHVFIGEPSACLTHPPAFNDTENKALSMTLTRASIFCSRLLRTQPAQLLTYVTGWHDATID
jgi:hypothetical protein